MTPGNVVYIAYGQQCDFLFLGRFPMPLWNELTDEERKSWDIAANNAIEFKTTGMTTLRKPENGQ